MAMSRMGATRTRLALAGARLTARDIRARLHFRCKVIPRILSFHRQIPLGATPKMGAASSFVASERRAGNGRKLLATATAKAADIRENDRR